MKKPQYFPVECINYDTILHVSRFVDIRYLTSTCRYLYRMRDSIMNKIMYNRITQEVPPVIKSSSVLMIADYFVRHIKAGNYIGIANYINTPAFHIRPTAMMLLCHLYLDKKHVIELINKINIYTIDWYEIGRYSEIYKFKIYATMEYSLISTPLDTASCSHVIPFLGIESAGDLPVLETHVEYFYQRWHKTVSDYQGTIATALLSELAFTREELMDYVTDSLEMVVSDDLDKPLCKINGKVYYYKVYRAEYYTTTDSHLHLVSAYIRNRGTIIGIGNILADSLRNVRTIKPNFINTLISVKSSDTLATVCEMFPRVGLCVVESLENYATLNTNVISFVRNNSVIDGRTLENMRITRKIIRNSLLFVTKFYQGRSRKMREEIFNIMRSGLNPKDILGFIRSLKSSFSRFPAKGLSYILLEACDIQGSAVSHDDKDHEIYNFIQEIVPNIYRLGIAEFIYYLAKNTELNWKKLSEILIQNLGLEIAYDLIVRLYNTIKSIEKKKPMVTIIVYLTPSYDKIVEERRSTRRKEKEKKKRISR